jgi:putative beta-barrel porin BBP2
MLAALILLVLLVTPAAAAAQAPPTAQTPPPPPKTRETPGQAPGAEFDLRTPPSPTIPSAPQILFPVQVPPPEAGRPTQTFEFHPLLGFSEEYSDNFNRSVSNHRDNFRTMVSPGMNVLLDSAFLSGSATYTISGFYDSFVDDFGYFNTFSGQLSWQAARYLKLLAAAGLNQSDQPEQADSLGLQVNRRRFTTANALVGAEWNIDPVTLKPYYRVSFFNQEEGPETLTNQLGGIGSLSIAQIHTLTLGYEYVVSDTSAVSGPKTQSHIVGNQFTGSFSRDLSIRTTAGISGSYAFRTQDLRLPDADTDFTLWSGSVFVNYAVTNTVLLRANVGVSQLSNERTDRDPIVTTNSSLSYWFGHAVATIGVDRGYAETFLGGENQGVVLTTGGRASLTYYFSPLLNLTGNVGYRENEFTGIGGIATPVAGNRSPTRTDKVLNGGLRLSYQIVRWLGAGLEYYYSRTDSSDVRGDVVENRVKLSLNGTF